MNATTLTTELKQRASELGFAASGACSAVTPAGLPRLREWVQAGYAGEMGYFQERSAAYEHPRWVLPEVVSLLMLTLPYRAGESSPVAAGPVAAGQGRVSKYAWSGHDYHDVIHGKLRQLRDLVHNLAPSVRTRGVVDTAPLLERDFAQRAGLGWIGKNTLLLNRELGSWHFLAALLLDCKLVYDEPFTANHCGSCTACLEACPTDAFPEPFVLDARRCISYLTIEHRSSIALEYRPAIGDWLFGCDICQDVCPWTQKGTQKGTRKGTQNVLPIASDTFVPDEAMNPVALAELFELDDAAFRARFRTTSLWRSHRRGLLRNAAIVFGNRPINASLRPLTRGLNDIEPLVRGASAWALGNLGSPLALTALEQRKLIETDHQVQAEIQQALDEKDSVSL